MPGWLALVVLSALCLAQETPPEDVGAHFESTVFGTTVAINSGLRGDIYFLRANTSHLPKFEKLKPVGTIYTKSLHIPPRNFTLGFPGVTTRVEWFAIDYTGKFWIKKPGKYHFALWSDDGTKLYIDERRLIDNDGIHPVKRMDKTMFLEEGIHRIRVSYFQGPRFFVALMLAVQGPEDKNMRVFHTDNFRPPDNWQGPPPENKTLQ
jgi:hypothetical protein